jgi:DNA replicative helicase MCM subunit Mcm2 (Cdc46/Mcm family)
MLLLDNVFWVAFYNVPAIHKLRDLTSNKIGKLLTVAGTVTRTSEVIQTKRKLIGLFSEKKNTGSARAFEGEISVF